MLKTYGLGYMNTVHFGWVGRRSTPAPTCLVPGIEAVKLAVIEALNKDLLE